MQASKVPWYKHDSQHAVHQITKASSWQRKQKAIDAYMDKKVQADATTDQNIASLQQKLQELSRHLSSCDADQVMARSSYYLQHMAGLVNQKVLMEESGNTEPAKVAFKADREEDPHSAIQLVTKHMRSSLHSTQGPNARVGAVRQCWSAVETALAFSQATRMELPVGFLRNSLTKLSFKPQVAVLREQLTISMPCSCRTQHSSIRSTRLLINTSMTRSRQAGMWEPIRAMLKTSCRPCYLCCTMLQSSNKCQLRLLSVSRLWQFRDKRSWRSSGQLPGASGQLPGASRQEFEDIAEDCNDFEDDVENDTF